MQFEVDGFLGEGSREREARKLLLFLHLTRIPPSSFAYRALIDANMRLSSLVLTLLPLTCESGGDAVPAVNDCD